VTLGGGSVVPMTMKNVASGFMTLVIHRLRPLST